MIPIPETRRRTRYFCSASMKRKSIFPRMTQGRVGRLHMPLPMVRWRVAVATASGGCGRPDTFRVVLSVSTVAARSVTVVTRSTADMTVFAPLCGSIWNLESSDLKSKRANCRGCRTRIKSQIKNQPDILRYRREKGNGSCAAAPFSRRALFDAIMSHAFPIRALERTGHIWYNAYVKVLYTNGARHADQRIELSGGLHAEES